MLKQYPSHTRKTFYNNYSKIDKCTTQKINSRMFVAYTARIYNYRTEHDFGRIIFRQNNWNK